MDTLQPRRSSERIANSRSFFSAFLFCLVLGAAAAAPGSATPDEQATPDGQATTPDEQATTPDEQAKPDEQATPAEQATTPDQPAAPNEQTLEDYAAECDKAIGVTVPDFDCDAGTDVPGQGNVFSGPDHPTATCDEPNRLRRKCDPGSRFQVLVRSDSAYIVAHCRKEGGDPGMYGDIAVIQYSRTNGATCFYQARRRKPRKHAGREFSPGHVGPTAGQGALERPGRLSMENADSHSVDWLRHVPRQWRDHSLALSGRGDGCK